MSPSRCSRLPGRVLAALTALGVVAAVTLCGGQPALAGWRPASAQRLDIQLLAPFDLARPVDVLALPLFGTLPALPRELQRRGTATICYVMAGVWESWRPDAAQFPQPVVGRPRAGRADQRWLDIRKVSLHQVLERRVELCRERGVDGVLLDGLDGYADNSGFELTPAQQLTFNSWLADVAHAHGLAAGIMNALDQSVELAKSFDFLVADACLDRGDCPEIRPFLAADKPVYLLAYTNIPRRMAQYCAVAESIGSSLIFKTRYLNGKLHRRC